MPYADIGQSSHQIAHCRKCKGQWVIAPGTKGVSAKENVRPSGRVCPFCGNTAIWYTRESNK